MRTAIFAAAAGVLLVSGCTAMRVTGRVLDSVTGEPAGNCYVTIGSRTFLTDFRGHFNAKVRRRKTETMNVTCPDHEPQVVLIDASRTRRPVVDVRMVPIRR